MSSVPNLGTTATERTKQETGAEKNSRQEVVSPHVEKAEQNASDLPASAQANVSEGNSHLQTAADQFQAQAGAKTDAAVAEGQRDVADAKAQSADYVAQAKDSANDTINAAYEFVSSGTDNHAPFDPNTPQHTDMVTSIQSTANTAYERTKSYLASAHQAAQPHIERAQAMVQPQIDAVTATAKPYAEKAQTALSSTLGSGTTASHKGKSPEA